MKLPIKLADLPAPPPGRTGWPWDVDAIPAAQTRPGDWPRISLATPSYNQAAFIEETIRSILLQGYPNLQYLVIDGGSTDGSVDIIRQYSRWIDYWVSEPDRGQSHAINKALARCDGTWFNWINSDDCLLPGALAAVGAAESSASLLCGEELMGPTLAKAKSVGHTRVGPTLEAALVDHHICQQATFFRLDVVRAYQGLREDLHYVMDLDLIARILLRDGLDSAVTVSAPLGFYRTQPAAKTSVASDKFLGEERRLIYVLAKAAELNPALLPRILGSENAAAEPPPAPIGRINRKRFARILASRFWWNGIIEVAWRERDFATFRRELRVFAREFPDLKTLRYRRLRALSLLPDPLLRHFGVLRALTSTDTIA